MLFLDRGSDGLGNKVYRGSSMNQLSKAIDAINNVQHYCRDNLPAISFEYSRQAELLEKAGYSKEATIFRGNAESILEAMGRKYRL